MRFFGGWLVVGACVLGCSGDDSDGSAGSGDTEFTGVCLGTQRQFYDDMMYSSACRAHFNTELECAEVEGCEWSDTFCSGFPKQCRTYGEAACSDALGCTWYGASRCKDELACNVLMYTTDGGCADVQSYVLGACSGDAYVDFESTCRGREPRPTELDCEQ